MYKKIILILGLGINFNIYADGIDVYGINDQKAQELLNSYGKKIFLLEKSIFQQRWKGKDDRIYFPKMMKLKNEIEKKYGFKSVLFETVYYPENKQIYTTIEVSKQQINDEISANYVPKTHDIVDKMIDFIQKVSYLMVHHPDFSTGTGCNDLHCITPEHVLVQKELNDFRQQVPKQQFLIENTIKNDLMVARRRAGIFLLAYYNDPQKVAFLLNDLLSDPSFVIRHDSLRVYGEMLQKVPTVKTSPSYFLPSIYSIHEAERNKALIVINELAKQNQYHLEIKTKMGAQLVKLLKLKQPNNHDLAYSILKQVWKKNYSETDYKHWEECLSNKS